MGNYMDPREGPTFGTEECLLRVLVLVLRVCMKFEYRRIYQGPVKRVYSQQR